MLGISILSVYVYCYFGKISTDCFQQLVNCIYEANWLEQRPSLRKTLILIMTNAQRPLYYHGFGFIIMNMGTFTQVNSCIDFATYKDLDRLFPNGLTF